MGESSEGLKSAQQEPQKKWKERRKRIIEVSLSSIGFLTAIFAIITFVFGKNLPDFFSHSLTSTHIGQSDSKVPLTCIVDQDPISRTFSIAHPDELQNHAYQAESDFADQVNTAYSDYKGRIAANVDIYIGVGSEGLNSTQAADLLAGGVEDALRYHDSMFAKASFGNGHPTYIFDAPTNQIELRVKFYQQGCTL